MATAERMTDKICCYTDCASKIPITSKYCPDCGREQEQRFSEGDPWVNGNNNNQAIPTVQQNQQLITIPNTRVCEMENCGQQTTQRCQSCSNWTCEDHIKYYNIHYQNGFERTKLVCQKCNQQSQIATIIGFGGFVIVFILGIVIFFTA